MGCHFLLQGIFPIQGLDPHLLCFRHCRSFPCSSVGKESACSAGDLGSIPGLGRSLVKEMATHFSILAWRIPQTEEPGRLQPMGS